MSFLRAHHSRVLDAVALGILALALSGTAHGSSEHASVAKGLENPTGYTFGGLDSVNLFNGALSLSLPIGQEYSVSPALSYRVGLTWMHAPWSYTGVDCTPGGVSGCDGLPAGDNVILVDPDERSNAGLGWRLSFPELVSPPLNGNTVYNLLEPDGTKRLFSDNLWNEANPNPNLWYSTDGSFLRLKLNQSGASCSTPVLSNCHLVELPSGLVYEFDPAVRTVAGEQALRLHRLRRIIDRFGHYVQIDYDATTKDWTITDSVGRSHTIEVSADPFEPTFERVDKVTLAAFEGTTASWDLNYTTGGFTVVDPGSVPQTTSTFSQLDSLTLPDGNSFALSYDTEFNVDQVDLPTGGHYAYEYAGWNVGPEPGPFEPSFPFFRAVTGVSERTENDGTVDSTWTYEHPVIISSEYHQTNVVTPEGDLTKHYFSTDESTAGLPIALCVAADCFDSPATANDTTSSGGTVYLSREEYEGQTGDAVRSVYLAYTGNSLITGANGDALFSRFRAPRIVAEKTVFHQDGDAVAETFYEDYDGLGHHRTQRLEGTFFGTDQDHWNKRLSTTSYNPSSDFECPWGFNQTCTGTPDIPTSSEVWLLELYDETTSKAWKNNANSTETFVQKLCFDSTTGFLEGRRLIADFSAPVVMTPRDVLQLFTEGTVATAGFVTKEEYFGGDLSNTLGTTGDPCDPNASSAEYAFDLTYQNVGLATRRAAGSTLDLADQTIDLNTGLVASSRDIAGVQTDFGYDDMSRIVDAQTFGNGDDACTVVEYLPPASPEPARVVTSTRSTCTGTTQLTRSETRYDGLGRTVEQRETMPGGGISKRVSGYTGSGWLQSVTELESSPTNGNSTRYNNYDRYGRPSLITGPDESAVSLTYSGVRRVTKTFSITQMESQPDFGSWSASDLTKYTQTTGSHSRTENYDRFGRLKYVQEATDPFDNSTEPRSTYFYAPSDRLSRVRSVEVGTTRLGAEQNRNMNYDGRGFLETEVHPENGTVSYKYDSRGNLREKTDALRTLKYEYDALERATLVEEDGADDIKAFTYYGQNSGSDLRMGKLKTAERFNEVGAGTASVLETYSYEGRAGRISRRSTLVTLPGGPTVPDGWAVPWTQGFVWDSLGNLSSLEYPCRSSLSTPDACASVARPVIFAYDRGFLTAVSDDRGGVAPYISEIEYHDNGAYKHSVFEGYLDSAQSPTDVRVSYGRDPAAMARPASVAFETGSFSSESWTVGATLALQYDGSGNVASFGGDQFFYDPAGRLQAMRGGLVQDYDYDNFGNRVAIRTITNSGATLVEEFEPTSILTNRLTKAGYGFDSVGNVTNRPGNVTYTWDPLNMVEHQTNGAAITYFLYTADDERIGVERPFGEGYDWRLRDLGGRVLSEFSSPAAVAEIFSDGFESGDMNAWSCAGNCGTRGASSPTELPASWKADLIHRGGNHEVTVAPGELGERRMAFVRDYLGTTRVVFQSDGGTENYYFLPFGRQQFPSPTGSSIVETTLRYTNHERDVGIETDVLDDLDYMRARYCSPLEGRFLSVDPINSGKPLSPQTWNRYAYGRNGPALFVDIDGKDSFIVFRSIAGTAVEHSFVVSGVDSVGGLLNPGSRVLSMGPDTGFASAIRHEVFPTFFPAPTLVKFGEGDGTYDADLEVWLALGKSDSGKLARVFRIDAPDDVVNATFDAIQENRQYSTTPGKSRRRANSNTGAVATAVYSSGSPTAAGGLWTNLKAPGSANYGGLDLDLDGDGKRDNRGPNAGGTNAVVRCDSGYQFGPCTK